MPRFKAATADRIGVYFDNTGGPVLEGASVPHGDRRADRLLWCRQPVRHLERRGRGHAACRDCSSTIGYGCRASWSSTTLARYEEARRHLSAMVADGSLRVKTTDFTGLDEAPRAFVELLAGGTVGTTIVTL